MGLKNFSSVAMIFKTILGILSPLIIGLCFAFIINVLLKAIEGKWDLIFKKTKGKFVKSIKRPLCLLISFAIIIGMIFVLFFLVIPEMGRTISIIADILPTYVQKVEVWLNQWVPQLENANISIPEIKIDWNKFGTMAADFLTKGSMSIINTTVGITSSIFSGILNIVLGIVFSIYILVQKENLSSQLKRVVFAFLPEPRAKSLVSFSKLTNQVFSKFVTGQLTEAFIIGILCFIGMKIFALPYATMISTLVGFTALIPVIGAFIGTIVGVIMIVMVSPIKALWFVIFLLVLQQLEGNLIYPRVVGKSVGLPGIWVLAAVTIGGSSFGILGMLLSVPVCSVLYTLLQQSVSTRLKNKKIK